MSKHTFSIGGVHPHDNKISRECAIEQLPLAPTVYLSMSQHIGAPAKPVVAVGDKVKVGQVVAEPGGFVSAFIHSSVSGTVKSIGPRKDLAGNPQTCIEIAVEGDEWVEGVDLSDRKSANATFRIKTADVQVIAVFVKKKDSDDDDHDEEPTPNNNVKYPDGFDELRVLLNNAASAAKATGQEQTVTWDKGISLPYDVMKMLQDNPKVTLEFSYTYQNQNYKVTIPGKNVIANPAIPWYGPLYLYMLYGDNKTPAFTTSAGTYTVKSGDTLSAIAKRLKTTLNHLKDINNIKNVDKIKPGMVLRY